GVSVGSKDWRINSLWNILTNRHLIGEREINKKSRTVKDPASVGKKKYSVTEAQWPAIVARSVFERAQALLKENTGRYNPGEREAFDYFLSSKLFCPECRSPLVGYSGRGRLGRKYYYYSHREKPVRCK